MACFTALASQSLPCQSTFHIDCCHSALYTVHICWLSYLDWNFTISTHQHKEVSSQSTLTILFSFVFNTRPGLHWVSATHTHTQIYLYLFMWIFSFILGQSVHPVCFIGWRFKFPMMPSLTAILPSLHLTSLCALKITHTALAIFNYICLFSCFAPSSNGTPRRPIFFGKIFHNIYACSLLKQIFKTSVSDTVEDLEGGWWRRTLYNYIGNTWKIGKWNILNKKINP